MNSSGGKEEKYVVNNLYIDEELHGRIRVFDSAFTETGATQTMKTNPMAELKQLIPAFSNPANQMSGTKQ